MKNKEMQEICNKYQYHCKDCPLNMPDNLWEKKYTSWCLLDLRKQTIIKYEEAMKKNNEVLASKILKEYQDIERKLKL